MQHIDVSDTTKCMYFFLYNGKAFMCANPAGVCVSTSSTASTRPTL